MCAGPPNHGKLLDSVRSHSLDCGSLSGRLQWHGYSDVWGSTQPRSCPVSLMTDFHVIYTLLIALSAVCGILGIVAGLALLAGNRVGRTLALIAAFLSLSDIPLGTTLGIYTLVVLLPTGAGSASYAEHFK